HAHQPKESKSPHNENAIDLKKIDTFCNVKELSHFLHIFEKVSFIENRGTILSDLFHHTREKRMKKRVPVQKL
ncbi:hypothetical protein CN634_30710, partial [Bacillus pseudomycoides]